MTIHERLDAKDLALTITFTALYVVFGVVKISPIIGLQGEAITAAAIMAPVIGMILGPYLGTFSALLGGAIGLSFGYFALPSFFSGISSTLSSGLLAKRKRASCILLYLMLLATFAFYPIVGPAWLYPPSLWFQILVLIVLVSPLQSMTDKDLGSQKNSIFLYTLFVISLTSTLAGQIAGSLVFESISWPLLIPDIGAWKAIWMALTLLYPIERVIIAVFSTLIGASLLKVLAAGNLAGALGRGIAQKRTHEDAIFGRHHHID